MPRLTAAAAVTAAIALGACAAQPVVTTVRVMVKLARPSIDAAAIAADASRASAHRVHYVAAVSEQWHVLSVSCDGAADCDGAVQRLREDSSRYAAVQRDQRKPIVSP